MRFLLQNNSSSPMKKEQRIFREERISLLVVPKKAIANGIITERFINMGYESDCNKNGR